MNILIKPILVGVQHKLRKRGLENRGEMGTHLRFVAIASNNSCNFKCEHCSTESPVYPGRR
jgi:MoaA/NifB/PqqE/SkfB family radical SAM enzyme